MKHKLLIIDDDEEIRTQMKWGLAKDYDIILAEDHASAVEAFQAAHPLVVLLDLGLPPRPSDPDEGLATLSDLLALERLTKVVVITGQGEKAVALRAIGSGAYDFLCKPVDVEEVKLVVKRGLHVASLEVEFRQMQQFLSGGSFEGMIGNSAAVRSVFEAIRKVATTDAPVLLLGESGTGREMAARAIHQSSGRKNGPFIAINCSAIPETLLESELFGHEKGAFTGAHAQRKGRFEMANGGTLFLDEIGEIPLALQVKLLRFLAEQCIERVGGRQSIDIDARIVTASHAFARTFFIAWRSSRSSCRPCAIARRTFGCWRSISCSALRHRRARRGWRLTRTPCGLWTAALGRETSASWRTASAARSSWPKANA